MSNTNSAHIDQLIANAHELIRTGKVKLADSFKQNSFLVDGPSEDPIENIKAISANEPVQLIFDSLNDRDTPFSNIDERHAKMGTITPLNENASNALKDVLLSTDEQDHDVPVLSNDPNFKINHGSNLSFTTDKVAGYEFPQDLTLTGNSQLTIDGELKGKDITLDHQSNIHTQTETRDVADISHSRFSNVQTVNADQGIGLDIHNSEIRNCVIDGARVSDYEPDDGLEAHAHAENSVIDGCKLNNFNFKDAAISKYGRIIDEFGPQKLEKPANELSNVGLTNTKINSLKPFKLHDTSIYNTAVTNTKLGSEVNYAVIGNSFLTDANAVENDPDFKIEFSALRNIIANNSIKAHSLFMNGDEYSPIVIAKKLDLAQDTNKKDFNAKSGCVISDKHNDQALTSIADFAQKPEVFHEPPVDSANYQKLTERNVNKNMQDYFNTPALWSNDQSYTPAEARRFRANTDYSSMFFEEQDSENNNLIEQVGDEAVKAADKVKTAIKAKAKAQDEPEL